jgi:hypothetical protein
MEALYETVGYGVVGGGPRELNATQLGQGPEKLGFELASLVGDDGLWAAEAGYPAGQ